MQIFLNKYSTIQRSPRKLDPQECQPAKPEDTKLKDFKDKPNFHHLSTRAKAISVHSPIVETGGKKKQDVIIADATATAPLTLTMLTVSSKEIPTPSVNSVKTFRVKKQLSVPRHATIATDDDITDAASNSSDSDSNSSKPMSLRNVEVIAVPVFSPYTACITCKARPTVGQHWVLQKVFTPAVFEQMSATTVGQNHCPGRIGTKDPAGLWTIACPDKWEATR